MRKIKYVLFNYTANIFTTSRCKLTQLFSILGNRMLFFIGDNTLYTVYMNITW